MSKKTKKFCAGVCWLAVFLFVGLLVLTDFERPDGYIALLWRWLVGIYQENEEIRHTPLASLTLAQIGFFLFTPICGCFFVCVLCPLVWEFFVGFFGDVAEDDESSPV